MLTMAIAAIDLAVPVMTNKRVKLLSIATASISLYCIFPPHTLGMKYLRFFELKKQNQSPNSGSTLNRNL